MSECTFNQDGFCVVKEAFPDWTCPLQDDKGYCTAKPDQLDYCCPFCGESDCDGDCSDCNNSEDIAHVPKKLNDLAVASLNQIKKEEKK